MGSELLTFLRLGVAHIADLRGYDHILFVAALTGGYAPAEWRRLLVLVTAFTLGHSATLALATLRLVHVDARAVEVLIPATILVTAALTVAAVRRAPGVAPHRRGALYATAALFGLVHGLGFSTYLRALLGDESSIVVPLLAFNVGLEVGQLAIVGATMLVGVLCVRGMGLSRRGWTLLLAATTGGAALALLIDRAAALVRDGGVR